MTAVKKSTPLAQAAIDDAFWHYFNNLTEGEKRITEIKFMAELITQIEPWLFFTEESLDNINKVSTSDAVCVNLINTLTVLFHMRFNVTSGEYETYLNQLAVAATINHGAIPGISLLKTEYSTRLPSAEMGYEMLASNRQLVMILTMIMYFDTDILSNLIGGS